MHVEPESLAQVVADVFPPNEPGGAVALVRGESVLFEACSGLAQLEHVVPWTTRTRTRIYSITKAFCGLAGLRLAELGRLDLDAACLRYAPELGASLAGVTPRHLLTNTAGVRDHEDLLLASGIDWLGSVDLECQIELLARQSRTNFAPGTELEYSNGGFRVFDAVLERAAAEPAREWFRRELLSPAGMSTAELVPYDSEIVPGLAQGYEFAPLGDRARYRLATHYGTSGDGGIVASLEDMKAFDLAVRRDGLAIPDLLPRWSERPVLGDGRRSGYGLGICRQRLYGHDCLHHSGGSIGYRSLYALFPALDLGLVVLANRHPFDVYAFAERLLLAAERELGLGVAFTPLPRADAACVAELSGDFVEPESGRALTFGAHAGWPDVRCASFSGGVAVVARDRIEAALGTSAAVAALERDATGRVNEIRLSTGNARTRFVRADSGGVDPLRADAFEGRYRSDELLADLRIASFDGRAHVVVGAGAVRSHRFPLRRLGPDTFAAGPMSFRVVREGGAGARSLLLHLRAVRYLKLEYVSR